MRKIIVLFIAFSFLVTSGLGTSITVLADEKAAGAAGAGKAKGAPPIGAGIVPPGGPIKSKGKGATNVTQDPDTGMKTWHYPDGKGGEVLVYTQDGVEKGRGTVTRQQKEQADARAAKLKAEKEAKEAEKAKKKAEKEAEKAKKKAEIAAKKKAKEDAKAKKKAEIAAKKKAKEDAKAKKKAEREARKKAKKEAREAKKRAAREARERARKGKKAKGADTCP